MTDQTATVLEHATATATPDAPVDAVEILDGFTDLAGNIMQGHIPPLVHKALVRYRDEHIPTGGFTRACLENNFVEAVRRADGESRKALGHIALFLLWALPAEAWGNKRKVRDWSAAK